MILFLIIDEDNHCGPEYHLRRDKDAALALAHKLSNEAKERYRDTEHYFTECTGAGGWWFHESGSCWKVTVREVKL